MCATQDNRPKCVVCDKPTDYARGGFALCFAHAQLWDSIHEDCPLEVID